MRYDLLFKTWALVIIIVDTIDDSIGIDNSILTYISSLILDIVDLKSPKN